MLMTFLRYIGVLFLLPLFFTVAGCGYHLTSTSTQRLAGGQRLWVPFIGNESVSPTAQTVLRRALYDECHALRGLVPAQNENSADLVVKGKLISYSSTVMSYSAADQIRSLRLTISAEMELYRRGESAPLFKGLLKAASDYPATADLALQRNAEESALEAASRILAQKLISATEQSY